VDFYSKIEFVVRMFVSHVKSLLMFLIYFMKDLTLPNPLLKFFSYPAGQSIDFASALIHDDNNPI